MLQNTNQVHSVLWRACCTLPFFCFVLSHCENWPSGSDVTSAVAESKRRVATCSFLTVCLVSRTVSIYLWTESSEKIKADKRGEVLLGNIQFPGAMATADCYNRLAPAQRETRGGEGWREWEEDTRRGGRNENERWGNVPVARNCSFFSARLFKGTWDSISFNVTSGCVCNSTTLVSNGVWFPPLLTHRAESPSWVSPHGCMGNSNSWRLCSDLTRQMV